MTTTDQPHVSLKQAFTTLGLVAAAVAAIVGVILLVNWVSQISLLWAALLLGGGGGLAALAVVRWWLLARHGRSWSALGFARMSPRLLHLLWQVPLILLVSAGVQGVVSTTLFEPPDPSAETSFGVGEALIGAPWWAVVLLVLAICVITPLWEESLFRGAFWSGFSRHLAAPWAILATGVLFAAVHAAPPAWPYLVSVGIGLTWLRWFHRSLWAPIIMHAINNGIVVMLGALLIN